MTPGTKLGDYEILALIGTCTQKRKNLVRSESGAGFQCPYISNDISASMRQMRGKRPML
jgi:hypothetical protein